VRSDDKNNNVIIVDEDRRRVSELAAMLRRSGCEVHTVDTARDFPAQPRDGALVLSADEGDSTARVLQRLRELRLLLPVIAYRQEPTARQVTAAIGAGASDYLAWPCEPALVTAAIKAVRSAATARWRKVHRSV
jgi:two-component system response regulator FixJ